MALGLVDQGFMITLTAPGAELLPWDPSRCVVEGPHKHSGEAGCKVHPEPMARWNVAIVQRWQSAREAALKDVSRRLRRWGMRNIDLRPIAWWYELQARGALHVHVVLPSATRKEKTWARIFCRSLAERLSDHGFGPQMHVGKSGPARIIARYLGLYMTTASHKGTKGLILTARCPEAPTTLVHVDYRLTRVTGATLQRLRRARRLWATLNRGIGAPAWADDPEEVAKVMRLLGPPAALSPAGP
jgi:hypothetical protein